MKNLIITLLALLVCIAAASQDILPEVEILDQDEEEEIEPTFHLRHRDLTKVAMCVNLGTIKGLHNIKGTKNKYVKKLARYKNAKIGLCDEQTKTFNRVLTRKRLYCKVWNRDHVTIKAPQGMRKWLLNEADAVQGSCGHLEDHYLEIYE